MKKFPPLLLLLAIACTSQQKDEYIINDEFESNSLGWTEENTQSHHTEIIDGILLIKSIDTAALYSSNGPADQSFFWSLPKKWQFSTSVEIIDGGTDAAFGVLLYSASLQYQFSFSRDGEIAVNEYDYNTERTTELLYQKNDSLKFDYNQPVHVDIKFAENQFNLNINNQQIGSGELRAKSWETLRIFAKAKGTALKADYYRIKAIK